MGSPTFPATKLGTVYRRKHSKVDFVLRLSHCKHMYSVRRDPTVNRRVIGSSPTGRAIRFKHFRDPILQLERPKQTEHQRLGDIVSGVFTPVLAKHSKSFSLIDCISVGVDRMQRNFEPMRKQVEAWQRSELTDVTAKVVIYEAFVEGKLEAPKHLARSVHDLYFEPKYEEFRPRTIWSLSNAFTSAFKELDPIPQFKATAKLGEFLEAQFSRAF
jgi:hypothetical protein